MTISYNWLSSYLPEPVDPDELSRILTSVGLEVESMEQQEKMKNKLKGLLVGEVLSCEKHPGADKLKLTKVSVGKGPELQIVCGAPNVAAGQKVVVATPGTVLHPLKGESFQIKKSKIRGVESEGMLCAEDEIGIGEDHGGILVLSPETAVGADYGEIRFPGNDTVFEIGLTPNRIDAMSHWGVARDVCAYLSHHQKRKIHPVSPFASVFETEGNKNTPAVEIKDKDGCKRYCGILVEGITVKESPDWLQQRLQSIGVKSINNIVDITNFILHETGQPLHAFDYDKIIGGKVIIQTVAAGTNFISLDGKERKLQASDLMICDEKQPMCIAGVYGGLNSSVTDTTKNVFLESAWFQPQRIRKTSMQHGLRTDAAARFEKGCDISNTMNVLQRAAKLIKEIAGGTLSGMPIDVYPEKWKPASILLSFAYVKKLSGKDYSPESIKTILTSLGFEITAENSDSITVSAPASKPDVLRNCDLVEEIMRIDGLDNIAIPKFITIAPAEDGGSSAEAKKEKISSLLTASGFNEILTNSISNSRFYEDVKPVTMINSLSSELDVMRPSMLESGLQAIAFNLNRRNLDLRLFEFGKTYHISGQGKFEEKEHLVIYTSGKMEEKGWNASEQPADFYYIKGVVEKICRSLGFSEPTFEMDAGKKGSWPATIQLNKLPVGTAGIVGPELLKKMEIKAQPVWYVSLSWSLLLSESDKQVVFREIPRFPAMERDLALVVDKALTYSQVQETVHNLRINQLKFIHLFDIFESEKLGKDKKSMAVRFVFQDSGKTLTDEEVDATMSKLVAAFEKNLNAEIRK